MDVSKRRTVPPRTLLGTKVLPLSHSASKHMTTSFESEAQLVDRLVTVLERRTTPWGRLQVLTEWDYRSGITDVLARTARKELIAFEAKLSNWRRAVYQAYRNTSFVVRAYVALPEIVAERLGSYRDVFARYGVGLCSLGRHRMSILVEARSSDPVMTWLASRAQASFDGMPDERLARPGGHRRPHLRTA
jgi:hypothetical protein